MTGGIETKVDYGFDRLERVTVSLEETDMNAAIARAAKELIIKEGKVASIENWGFNVRIEKGWDYVRSWSWAEVTFTRRFPDSAPSDTQKEE